MIDYMDSTGNNSGSIQSSSSCGGGGGGGDEYDSSSHLVALPTENPAAFPSSVLNHQHFHHRYPPQQEKNIICYAAACAQHVTQTSHFSIDPPLPPPPVAAPLAPVARNGSVDGNPLPNVFDRSNNLNPNSTVWSRRTAAAIRSSNAASCTAYDENYSYNPTRNQSNSSIAYSTTMDPVFSHNLNYSQPPPPVIHGAACSPPPTTTTSDHQLPAGHLPRTHPNKAPAMDNNTGSSCQNSKKRTRASRRAPTTVLTTDTTNFRAMVQEFTGVPSPPFFGPTTTSFLFPRTNRLDLLSSGSTAPSTTLPSSLLLHHPTRPLPQTYATFPFVSPSTPPTATPASHSSSSAAVVLAATTTVDCSSVSGTGETGGGNDHVYDYGNKNRPPLLTRDQHPWDLGVLNLQRDTTTTGLSFSVPVQPDGSYPVPNPRTGSLDVPVTGCTTAGLISCSSRLSIGIEYSAGSLPALETAREENNNRVSNRSSAAGRTNSPHHNHHQQMQVTAGNGISTIESWLCSSSTSTD